MFELVEQVRLSARIKVIGVGGGGGNAINTMIAAKLTGKPDPALHSGQRLRLARLCCRRCCR